MENQPVNPAVSTAGHGGQFEMVDPGTGTPLDTGGQPIVAPVVAPVIAEPAKPLDIPQPAVPVQPVAPVAPVVTDPIPTVTDPAPQEPVQQEPNFIEDYGFKLETYDDRNTPVDINVKPGEPDGVKVDPSPKTDPNQFEYWQSQADSRGSDLNYILGAFGASNVDEFKLQYNELKDLIPIARYIQKQPQILDTVNQSLSNGSPLGQPGVAQQPQRSAEPLKKPERPVKPEGYNAVDAYSDPDSVSFKYQRSVDAWRDSMFDYSEDLRVQNEAQAIQTQEHAHVKAQMQRTFQTLVSDFKYQPQEANQLLQYITSPASESLENLVLLWEIKKQPAGSIKANMQRAEELRVRAQKQTDMKPPVSTASAELTRPLTDEEAFNIALMQRNKVNIKR